ncbi:TadE/TadG family type IV pilus assembly protein [Microvirga aerilata]|uniref:TadE/TadG family type IV pilus assembly protein n=1 Tax=Microvirga aerilata TaxID=670292 RepID=UPI00364580FA
MLSKRRKGAAALEMAMLAPAFLTLLLGIFQGGLLVFTQASLHYAVHKSVRCVALQDVCPSPASYYLGTGAAPEFTPAQEPCGRALTATVSYTFTVLLYHKEILLSAKACFPNIRGS